MSANLATATERKALRAIQGTKHRLEQEQCRRSAHYFIFRSGLVTKDEHNALDPIRPFPDELYLRALLDHLLLSGRFLQPEDAGHSVTAGFDDLFRRACYESRLLAVEKSRQMIVTWLVSAYALWRAKFHDHQLVLWQSKREDDAANVVFNKEAFIARISFMETHLPMHLRTAQFPKAGSYGQLMFPNGSRIWGIPEGGDIIRSNTASCIVSDEAAFQPEFGASVAAALPAIKGQGQGQYVAISSAEPGEFMAFVEAA